MKTWSEAIRDGAVSGSIASLASTAALSACGRGENRNAYAPTNATSHWVWGEHATSQGKPSMKYTALGYGIHHASSMLWATVYEKMFGKRAEDKALEPALAGGLAVAALACFVDLKLTPQRLTPGFERHLSARSLFLVYATFGLALAVRGFAARESGKRGKELWER